MHTIQASVSDLKAGTQSERLDGKSVATKQPRLPDLKITMLANTFCEQWTDLH